jgi:hypothetical protein
MQLELREAIARLVNQHNDGAAEFGALDLLNGDYDQRCQHSSLFA